MLQLIEIENIFGRFCEDIYTIKYQKRGSSYKHLFIFLNLANEFFEVSHINKVIYIKLLIIESDSTGELIKIVTSVILHDPYEKINSYLFCISNICDNPPRCTKNYFRNFLEKTSIQENSYLFY